MAERIQFQGAVPEELSGQRLDIVLAKLLPAYSRSRMQQWIKEAQVLVDGHPKKARDLIELGQLITIDATLPDEVTYNPQKIALNIIYEDDDILVIDKPAGLVVHPGTGNPNNTLLNALLHHEEKLVQVPRAGIIHRIDKETSGLLVIAKTVIAHHALILKMQEHEINREYICLVTGELISGGTVETSIGRHPHHRTKMAVTPSGKQAITHYRIRKKYEGYTLLDVTLETGRTHQIRVHMAHINYPIVGDPVYGGRLKFQAGLSEEVRQAIRSFPRQALHAHKLTLQHPVTEEWLSFESPLPEDIQNLLKCLTQK